MRLLPVLPQAAARRAHWLQGLESLQHHDYRLVWTTSFLSSAARWIQQVSLGWLAFDLTGSAFLLGSIVFVYQAPAFLLSPVIGVLVDRLDRRRLLIWSQVAMAVVAAILAVDIALGWVQPWHLFVFAVLSGLESSVIHVLRQALIPSVVPRESLMNAIALNSAALTSTRIGAPFLGGVLIVLLGVSGNFLIQGLLLIGVAGAAFPLRVKPLEMGENESYKRGSVWAEIAVGLRYIWGIEALRALFLLQFIVMLLAMPVSNFLPVWAADILSLDADGLGLLFAALGIGALAGTLVLAWTGNVKGKGLLGLGASAGTGLALLGLAVSPGLPLPLIFLAMLGIMQSVFSTTNMTLVQSMVPEGLQGRVMSVYNMGHSMIALGSLIMGAVAGLAGMQAAVIGSGVALLGVTLLYPVLVPAARRL